MYIRRAELYGFRSGGVSQFLLPQRPLVFAITILHNAVLSYFYALAARIWYSTHPVDISIQFAINKAIESESAPESQLNPFSAPFCIRFRNILPLMAANAQSINYTPTSQKEAEKVKILTASTFFFRHSIPLAIVVLRFLYDATGNQKESGPESHFLAECDLQLFNDNGSSRNNWKRTRNTKNILSSYPFIIFDLLLIEKLFASQQSLIEYSASSAIVGQCWGISSCFY